MIACIIAWRKASCGVKWEVLMLPLKEKNGRAWGPGLSWLRECHLWKAKHKTMQSIQGCCLGFEYGTLLHVISQNQEIFPAIKTSDSSPQTIVLVKVYPSQLVKLVYFKSLSIPFFSQRTGLKECQVPIHLTRNHKAARRWRSLHSQQCMMYQ